MESTIKRVPVPIDESKLVEFQNLCIVFTAVNETCKARNEIKYSSGDSTNDVSLTEMQKFLCKLAQVCDTRKGGDTITALVALKGARGPEFLFTSNSRKTAELEDTRQILLYILQYVGANTGKLGSKVIQKHVLWKILEFNYPKLDLYLKGLNSALDQCISECQRMQDLDTLSQLTTLKDMAHFPRDMVSSENSKPKFLCDCVNLIKTIQSSKEQNSIETIVEGFIPQHQDTPCHWSELRHFLGRLHSYRQASEIISKAADKWPELFNNFTINPLPSSSQRRIRNSQEGLSNTDDVLKAAFPNVNLGIFATNIEELKKSGLDEEIVQQLQKPKKTQVHCEVHLYDHLISQGKTRPSDFWDGSMFIATSKPTCKLCHYFFNDSENDFQVQSPHMNLYPKWRLPDIYEDQGDEVREHQEDLMDDILDNLRNETLQIVREKFPRFKRNDSRTDSRNSYSTMSSKNKMYPPPPPSPPATPKSTVASEDGWVEDMSYERGTEF